MQTVNRRTALGYLGSLAALPALPSFAQGKAVNWPSKPARIINPFPVGGAPDALSRLGKLCITDFLGCYESRYWRYRHNLDSTSIFHARLWRAWAILALALRHISPRFQQAPTRHPQVG